jgi:plasmid replication initiation protein
MVKKNKKLNMVVYHNNYIEAFYQVDLLAKKIMIASSLKCRKSDWSKEGCEIILSSNELKELAGVKRNSLKHLEHAVRKLAQTVVTLKDPQNPKDFIVFNYLPHGEYKEGVLKMVINSNMKSFVTNLQDNYTQYHIENIKPLKSEYSIRIFELLKKEAFKNAKSRFLLKELRKMLGVVDKYKDYNMFKRRVLDKAKMELREHCEIYFEFKEIKIGRKVTEIEFEIIKQDKIYSDYEVELDDKTIISETESKLKILGWNGNYKNLLKQVSEEAIEHYYETIKSELIDIDVEKIDSTKLHEYIDESLRMQAQRSYNLFKSINKTKKQDEPITVAEKKYSPAAKKLIELGFIGDVITYVENEGEELIEKALDTLKTENTENITNKIGFLREKIKAIKLKEEILEKNKQEEKASLDDMLSEKLDKYINSDNNFEGDYERFLKSPKNNHPEDQIILQKYTKHSIDIIPKKILNEFLDWRL